jgi:hypothetical protein
MKTIRPGVFETNSSSVHCIVITTEDKYKAFEDGEYMFNGEDDDLEPTIDVFKKLIADEDYVDWCKDNEKEPIKFDQFQKVISHLSDWDDDKADEEAKYIKDWLSDNSYQTCDEFFDNEYYETYEKRKTFGDVNIVAFGYYGHD